MTKESAPVLAADIGGTKTLLRLAAPAAGRLVTLSRRAYPSRAYASLDDIVADFLRHAGAGTPARACFAVAGPVAGNCAKLTNLSWQVDAQEISRRFGIAQVGLINDFTAVGLGIEALEPEDLLTLQAGKPQPEGVRAVVGAGTGLGVGWLVRDGRCYRPHPSEGGHMDFAPGDAAQQGLLEFLRAAYGHVSWERIVSGPGLAAIFDYLRQDAPASPELLEAVRTGDAAAAISAFALEKRDRTAEQALEMFVALYGAFAGNIALALLPAGGVYIAGGIAPKIAARLGEGGFVRAFLDKGRFAGLLATIPLHVVRNEEVGLIGASLAASRL